MFIRHLITTLAITTLLTTTAARVFTGGIAIFTTVDMDPVITTEDTIADTVNRLINTAARPAHGSAVFFG